MGISGVRGLNNSDEQAEIVRMGAREGRLEIFGWSASLSRLSWAEEMEGGVETEVNEVEPLDEGDEVVEDRTER
jgi:hypothetical protein